MSFFFILDVEDPTLNLILNGCILGIATVTFLSLVPWSLKDGRNRWTLMLPLVAIAIYTVYEIYMPNRIDIRIDLLIIFPLLLVTLIAWLARVIVVAVRRRT